MCCAIVLVASAGGSRASHGPNLWSGRWITSTGSFALRRLHPDEIQTAKEPGADKGQLFAKLPCKSGPQLYRGGYASGGDLGKIMGCGTATTLRGRFLSNVNGAAGSFSIHISSRQPLKFAGTFSADSGGGSQTWTGTWSNHFGGDNCCSSGGGGGGSSHGYSGPFEVDIRYHANNLPTAPPIDGGRCPEARVGARVTGTIVARRTDRGEFQGGGDVADTPHLNRCRVPVIRVRVDKVELAILIPGKRLQATLHVHIDAEGVHRPGDCRVGTRGTITATYDDTLTVSNSLRNHRLRIGPWQALGCTAHDHTITNSITSITAYSSSSTWVTVWIGCTAPGTGRAPRNCK